jgi:hypothetical protein
MQNRLAYPLTEAAKRAARELVGAWDDGEIDQYFSVPDEPAGDDFLVMVGDEGEPTRLSAFLELDYFGLISVERQARLDPAIGYEQDWWDILLLQALREAVAGGFAVSDFFLATSTPGAVIHLGEGAVVAGAAYGAPPRMESVEQLSDKLMNMMGDSAMAAHPPLRTAIDDLRDADTPSEVRLRAGRVIEEVGRGIVALANAGAAIEAIQLIGHFLG